MKKAKTKTTKAPPAAKPMTARPAKYPRHSVEKALRIPKAILEQNGGHASTLVQAAGYLGLTNPKGPFAVEIGSAKKFRFLDSPEKGNPDGSATHYVYSGNTVTVTDPAGRWKKFTMDNSAAGERCGTVLTGQDLGGLTLTPGVYCFESSAQLTGTYALPVWAGVLPLELTAGAPLPDTGLRGGVETPAYILRRERR